MNFPLLSSGKGEKNVFSVIKGTSVPKQSDRLRTVTQQWETRWSGPWWKSPLSASRLRPRNADRGTLLWSQHVGVGGGASRGRAGAWRSDHPGVSQSAQAYLFHLRILCRIGGRGSLLKETRKSWKWDEWGYLSWPVGKTVKRSH